MRAVMRAVVVLFLLLGSVTARADWLMREIDTFGGGGGVGGGKGAGKGTGSAGSQDEPSLEDLSAWAGEPRAITLPEVLQIAVRQAPTLQSARLDVAIAEATVMQTWSRHDWLVQMQGTGVKQLGSVFGLPVDQSQYGGTADLSRQLPTGGTVDLHVGASYQHNIFHQMNSTATTDSKLWQSNADIALTQPLLRGRGVWLYDAQERRAQLSRDVAVLARRSAAITTVENVIAAYWDLVLAERQVAITQASLDLARERLRVTEIGAHGGKIAEAEIPAVQQIIATREEDVLNGELAVVNASIALRRAAGMPIGAGDLGLRVATDLEIRDDQLDLKSLVAGAFSASPELAELAKQGESATIDIEVTENGLLPQLDAAFSAGPVGQNSTFNQSVNDASNFTSLAITGSLTFSQSIGRHALKGQLQQQIGQRQKLRVSTADIQAQVAQAMSRAVAGLELAKRRVHLSQRAIELAKQNIKIETDRFNLGTRTNFDVLNRLEELRQAELREAQAKIDWHKAENAVQALTGDILPAFGIHVD
jgi:outer membrane protein TolC